MPIPGKRKLTLTVDSAVVEKARDLGLNLSDITEQVLRGFAFSASDGSESVVREKYKELFEIIRPLLQEYNIRHLAIGEDFAEEADGTRWPVMEFFFGADGKFSDEGDNELEMQEIPLVCVYEPTEILANFVRALSAANEKSKEKVEKLEMAKRIVLAMSEQLSRKQRPTPGPDS